MIVYKCDFCKRECELRELGSISYPEPESLFWRKLSEKGLMQGTRIGSDHVCPECFQKTCWAINNANFGEHREEV